MDYQLAVEDEDTPDRAAVSAEPLTEDPQPAAMAWAPDDVAMPDAEAEPEAIALGDPDQATAMAWAPDDVAMPGSEEEPEAAGLDDPDQPMVLSAPDAEAEPVPEPPAAVASDGMSTRWSEIQAMFVDDPRSSAEGAAGLVEDGVQELVAFVREQQDALLAAWHGQDTGTEELRTAVKHYRAFGNRLADFCRES
jgi:hypothetical protein